jgi:hypothetical protein
MDTFTPIHKLISAQAPRGEDTDPATRWWRTRIAMKRFIDEHAPERSIDYLIDALYSLPGVWNESQWQARMFDIRDAAVEAYENDDICVDGLNRFLAAFDLDEYEMVTTKRVTVSITVTLDVTNTADEYDVRDDVENYLRISVDTSRVDDVDGDDYDINSVDVWTQ